MSDLAPHSHFPPWRREKMSGTLPLRLPEPTTKLQTWNLTRSNPSQCLKCAPASPTGLWRNSNKKVFKLSSQTQDKLLHPKPNTTNLAETQTYSKSKSLHTPVRIQGFCAVKSGDQDKKNTSKFKKLFQQRQLAEKIKYHHQSKKKMINYWP